MKRRRVLLGVVLFIFILLLIILGFFWIQVRQLKPNYEEELTISGLRDSVMVRMDSSGVPHIIARNEADLIMAMGYVVASERLWQMEMTRRVGRGRLSEVFGDTTLKIDRLFRTLGFDSLALQLYSGVSPQSREWMDWYARGVNKFIQKAEDNLPIEFQLLRISEVEPWRPHDALIVQRFMAWILNFNWKADFLYWNLRQKLPEKLFREILPVWGKFPQIVQKSREGLRLLGAFWRLDDDFRYFLTLPTSGWGSNSWVVDGSLTYSGKPILANDPHLELRLPSIWIEVHLSCPELEVAGFSLPGTPGIIIGRNQHIAWGLTNGMIDDSDYFLEEVDTTRKVYRYRNQDLKLVLQRHSIRSGAQTEIYPVFKTHHGPLVNSIFPGIKTSAYISLHWVGWYESDELLTFYKLARARDWNDFRSAISHFKCPAQNFIYADARGNIGYQLGGAIPIRKNKAGLLPRRGTSGFSEWQGFIPFDLLPRLLNPEMHWIVTANNKIVQKYPYYLSEVWEPPFRAQRITQMILQNRDAMTVSDMISMQMDVLNLAARELLTQWLRMVKQTEVKSLHPRMEEILLLLSDWEGKMTESSVAATIYEVWQFYFLKNIFADEMGDALFNLFVDLPNFYLRIFYQIAKKKYSFWFDDKGTKDKIETKKDIVIKSLADALQYLTNTWGPELYRWEWGRIHRLKLSHSLGSAPFIGSLLNRGPFPVAGNPFTVNVGSYLYANAFDMNVGASCRFIMDWGEAKKYWSVIPGGNSGNIFSPFYANQLQWWLKGRLKQVRFNSLEDFKHERVLIPAR